MKIKQMIAIVMLVVLMGSQAAFTEDNVYVIPQYIGGENIRSIRKGDTFVVSIEAFLLEKEYFNDPSTRAEPDVCKGDEAVEKVRSMLPKVEFEIFCDDYEQKGEAKGTAYVLDFVGDDAEDLSMDTRLIGSKWVTITRPIETVGNEWDTAFYVNRMELHATNGKMETKVTGSNKAWLYLEPERIMDVKANIQVKKGNLNIEVFSLEKQLDAPVHVAVIKEKNGAEKQLWDVYLRIGDALSNPLSGYVDGGNAVFCCILNDTEAKLLKDNAAVALLRG